MRGISGCKETSFKAKITRRRISRTVYFSTKSTQNGGQINYYKVHFLHVNIPFSVIWGLYDSQVNGSIKQC